MEATAFEEKMNAFVFRDHQFFVAYLKTLGQRGLTIEDAIEYIESKKAETIIVDDRNRRSPEFSNKTSNMLGLPLYYQTPKCPECGKNMDLIMVNHNKRSMVGDPKAQTMWICTDEMNCGYLGDLSEISAKRWIEKFQRGWRQKDGL